MLKTKVRTKPREIYRVVMQRQELSNGPLCFEELSKYKITIQLHNIS